MKFIRQSSLSLVRPLVHLVRVRGFKQTHFIVGAFLVATVFALDASAFAASLTLEWDPPADAGVTGYILSYGAAPGEYAAHLDVGSVTRFQVSGLIERAYYCFAVQAYTLTGATSAYSTTVCSNTPSATSSTGTKITVNTGGDLQAAFDSAKPGDTVLLQAGATFVGNFVLPQKADTATAYITIRSTALDGALPGTSTRMTPTYAAQLPKLRSPNAMPALATAPGAHHYRLQFLEFLPTADDTGTILELGDGTSTQDTLDMVPHHLILDRVYVHGDATNGQLRGVALNSASTTIVNSYISEIKSASADAQAIAGWNGPGPYVISNNYLEASGQNVQFGGTAPFIPLLVPSGITLERNLITKPLAWKLQQWSINNLLAFRSAEHVIVDGNILENTWIAGPSSYAIHISSPNLPGPIQWSVLRDLQFTNNTVRNVSAGVYLARGAEDQVSEIGLRNNLFAKINGATLGGWGLFLTILGASDVTVDHNTVINDGYYGVYAATWSSDRFVFTNNVMRDKGSTILGAGGVAGRDSISRYFPGGEFLGSLYIGKSATKYPVGNSYPATISDVKFAGWSIGNYQLSPLSLFRNAGTDGTDPGCDFEALFDAQR